MYTLLDGLKLFSVMEYFYKSHCIFSKYPSNPNTNFVMEVCKVVRK